MLIIIKRVKIILAREADLVEELKVSLISLQTAIVMAEEVVALVIRFNKLETGSRSHPNRTTPIMEALAIHHLKTGYRRNRENPKKARDPETLVAQGCTIQWWAIWTSKPTCREWFSHTGMRAPLTQTKTLGIINKVETDVITSLGEHQQLCPQPREEVPAATLIWEKSRSEHMTQQQEELCLD